MNLSLMMTLICAAQVPADLSPPVEQGLWIVPAQNTEAQPYWGIKNGIAISLWPHNPVRGLFGIYAPYLGHDRNRMVNFIAIEPIVGDWRGYSEMEKSKLDGQRGLVMWTSNKRLDLSDSKMPHFPAKGEISVVDGTEELSFYVYTETFGNGSRPVVQVILRQDRPYEVGFKLFSQSNSAPVRSMILTATMGNYAMLRHLWLKGEVVDSRKIWPDLDKEFHHFSSHAEWSLGKLLRRGDEAIVACTPSDPTPSLAPYTEAVNPWWRYSGPPATQYWKSEKPREDLVARVNGRTVYFGSGSEIPGGISYENFEMEEAFSEGQEFFYGVTPKGPESLGFDKAWGTKLTDGK